MLEPRYAPGAQTSCQSPGIFSRNRLPESPRLRLAVAVVILAAGFVALGALLSAPAAKPTPADVAVVLGGDSGDRFAVGLNFVEAGLAPRLLLIHPSRDHLEQARKRLGASAVFVDDRPRDSWDEATDTRVWLEAHHLKRALVVSDPPHMLRLWYTWGKVLRGTGLSYSLAETHPRWWSRWAWWRDARSRDFVADELVKLAYYLVRH